MMIKAMADDGNESSYKQSLKKLSGLLKSNVGFFSDIQRVRQYYDEPKFWHFTAEVNSQFLPYDGRRFSCYASGCSFFSKDLALLKCLGESIERYCNFYFSHLFISEFASVSEVGEKSIPINDFARYSQRQLKRPEYKRFVFASNSKAHWVECFSLLTNKPYLIPANFIYLASPYNKTEPLIYPVISTGVAGGMTLAAAIVRGIYEIIERDAFTIFYINKLPAPQINLENIKSEEIKCFIELAKRYALEITCLDLTTDLGIPVIGAIVIDRSGIGKAVSVGLKSDLNIVRAVVGAITEAFHTRGRARRSYESLKRDSVEQGLDSFMGERALVWYELKQIPKLDFWLQGDKYAALSFAKNNMSISYQLEYLTSRICERGYDIYWKDLTIKAFIDLPYHVVKVIIPQLQPLIFDEKLPLTGGERINTVPVKLGFRKARKLNLYPHPFI